MVENTTLFQEQNCDFPAIVLIDASGSTYDSFNSTQKVFDRICELVKTFPEESFRVIFWNSDIDVSSTFFTKGIYILSFVVKKATIEQPFMMVKPNITRTCLTSPHLGFNAIPDSWLNPNGRTKVYFITDGQIGYGSCPQAKKIELEQLLGLSIVELARKAKHLHLSILTVEAVHRDFGSLETMNKAAGGDVYRVIMAGKLTEHVSQFISFTPNNNDGFVHLNKNAPPPGYIPYGAQFFSVHRTDEFIQYLTKLIGNTSEVDELLQIAQNLSSSLVYLTRDKSPRQVTEIINTFSQLFEATELDDSFVNFILSKSVNEEIAGQASIFASYRSRLRDLYQQANEMLTSDVRNSIGLRARFVTLPIDGKIVTGNRNLIDQSLLNNAYAGCLINGNVIPAIPLDSLVRTKMNDQCLRQWVRQVLSKMFRVNVTDDSIIYLSLMLVLQVVLSKDLSNEIKDAYRRMGLIMLNKKRYRSDVTELEHLLAGYAPDHNCFTDYMKLVNKHLNTTWSTWSMWYMLCLALDHKDLCRAQWKNCYREISGVSDNEPKDLLFDWTKDYTETITAHDIPDGSRLEYNCIITLEDTSLSGGYRFRPHVSGNGANCAPLYVLSQDGYDSLTKNSNTCVCPICYRHLTADDFEQMGPKPHDVVIFQDRTFDIFSCYSNETSTDDSSSTVTSSVAASSTTNSSQWRTQGSKSNADSSTSSTADSSSNSTNNSSLMSNNKLLVILKGTVGAGKSTFGTKLAERLSSLGYKCAVEGTDKYCRTGMNTKQAMGKVKQSLSNMKRVSLKGPTCVIIDTCGERNTGSKVFNTDFSGWKMIEVYPNYLSTSYEEYLIWSLRNVFRRQIPGSTDNHYLNPVSAGIQTCKFVHRQKAEALFPRQRYTLNVNENSLISKVIDELDYRADVYQTKLDSKMPLDKQIEQFVTQHVTN